MVRSASCRAASIGASRARAACCLMRICSLAPSGSCNDTHAIFSQVSHASRVGDMVGVDSVAGSMNSTLEQYLDKTPGTAELQSTLKGRIQELQNELEAFARQIHQSLDREPKNLPSTAASEDRLREQDDACSRGSGSGGGCCQGSSSEGDNCPCAAPTSTAAAATTTTPVPPVESESNLEEQQARYHTQVLELLRSVWPDATL